MGHHTVQSDKSVPTLPKHTLLPSSGMRRHQGRYEHVTSADSKPLESKRPAPPCHSCGGMLTQTRRHCPHGLTDSRGCWREYCGGEYCVFSSLTSCTAQYTHCSIHTLFNTHTAQYIHCSMHTALYTHCSIHTLLNTYTAQYTHCLIHTLLNTYTAQYTLANTYNAQYTHCSIHTLLNTHTAQYTNCSIHTLLNTHTARYILFGW
jgi:hypothetical protein